MSVTATTESLNKQTLECPAFRLELPCLCEALTLATTYWRLSTESGAHFVGAGDGKRGWVLLRASLHDPLLVLNVESDVEGGASKIASQARPPLPTILMSVFVQLNHE